MPSTNREKLLKVFTPEFDELYVTFKDIINAIQVDTAKGTSLDLIGELLSFIRNINETDSIYRDKLINIININTIAGTKIAIKKLLSNYLRIDETKIIIIEIIPNYIIVQLPTEYEIYDTHIKDILSRSIAAGIYVGIYYSGTYWDVALWDNVSSKWG